MTCFLLGWRNWRCYRVIRGWCTERCVCPLARYHRHLSLFVCLCGRGPSSWWWWRSIYRCFLQMSLSGDSLLLTAFSCHLFPFFIPICIHFLPMNLLLLFRFSHLPPGSLDSDLALSLLCTCNLARRPSALFEIS